MRSAMCLFRLLVVGSLMAHICAIANADDPPASAEITDELAYQMAYQMAYPMAALPLAYHMALPLPEPLGGTRKQKRSRFQVGSRYGRSQAAATSDTSDTLSVAPRNNRFFTGSRYGKRGAERMQPVAVPPSGRGWMGDGGQMADAQRLICVPFAAGVPSVFRCRQSHPLVFEKLLARMGVPMLCDDIFLSAIQQCRPMLPGESQQPNAVAIFGSF